MSSMPSQMGGMPVLTVSQITHAIKTQLERTFPEVWIKGEVSNFRNQSSGHLYFSLKDAGAQISAVMFRGNATGLPRPPKDGDQVVAQGELNVYPPRGNYQLVIRSLTFQGAGELLLRLERLKQELKVRGWFDSHLKKPLPAFPKTIGLVTSPTGAVIQDMLHVLNRRHSGLKILLNPVKVQGEGAAQEIAKAIQQMNDYRLCDVIIVGRGGGSIEDLWAFNEEVVAKAIFESRIPVISAVGHETDYSIADLVADVRAPTPSAAAEIVTAEKAQCLTRLLNLSKGMENALKHALGRTRQKLDSIQRHPLLRSPYALLGIRMQRLDDIKAHLQLSVKRKIEFYKLRLSGLNQKKRALNPSFLVRLHRERLLRYSKSLDQLARQAVQKRSQNLAHLKAHLNGINPQNLLKKGYSILFSEKDGSVISSVQVLPPEHSFRARLFDGEVVAVTKEVIPCDREKFPTPRP